MLKPPHFSKADTLEYQNKQLPLYIPFTGILTQSLTIGYKDVLTAKKLYTFYIIDYEQSKMVYSTIVPLVPEYKIFIYELDEPNHEITSIILDITKITDIIVPVPNNEASRVLYSK